MNVNDVTAIDKGISTKGTVTILDHYYIVNYDQKLWNLFLNLLYNLKTEFKLHRYLFMNLLCTIKNALLTFYITPKIHFPFLKLSKL